MREVEKKISDLKEHDYDSISKPVCAFITFEEEDGINRALDYEPRRGYLGKMWKSEETILGEQTLAFVDACEPTNIIWENRQIEGHERWKRLTIASTIIVILILVSFSVIFFSKQYSIKVTSKYPTVACAPIKSTYGSQYEFWAVEEWKGFYEAATPSEQREFTGVLPCFCQDK